MIIRAVSVLILTPLFANYAIAQIAPEITTVVEGYHIIAKLPCTGCPLLSQSPSQNQNAQSWIQTSTDNALLLNITLPFSSTHLTINTVPLLTPSPILPKIHANQVPLSLSTPDLNTMLESDSLDTAESPSFALSYAFSLHSVADSPNALLFHFEVMEMYSDLPDQPMTVVLDNPAQKMLEIVLLRRPLLSAASPWPGFEILRAELISRPESSLCMTKMWYNDWEAHGRFNTFVHFLARTKEGLLDYASSGVWALFIFIFALMGLLVVVCVFCCVAVGWMGEGHAYEKAQVRKRMRRQGWIGEGEERERGRGDLERGRRIEGVLGVGKSD